MTLDLTDFAQTPEDAWDEKLWRQGRAKHRRVRRQRLGSAEKQARLRGKLAERQEGLCHYCGRQMVSEARTHGAPVPDEQVTLEHLIPFADGGETSEENCRAACFRCNVLKGRLDQAIRGLEKSMCDVFPHATHYYAHRLRTALDGWDARVAPASGMETEGQDPAEGLGAEHDSPTAKPGRPDTSPSVASPSQEQM